MNWNRIVKNWEIDPPEAGGAVIELQDFPVYKQQTDHTCGPTAIRMTLAYLGLDVDEAAVARRCLTFSKGTLHWPLEAAFKHFLGRIGYTVDMVGGLPDVYECIRNQLENNLPVPFIFSTVDYFHPDHIVSHYAVITGLDEPAYRVRMANPFGFSEVMDIGEWWVRFSMLPGYVPPMEGTAVAARLLKPRTAFFVKKL